MSSHHRIATLVFVALVSGAWFSPSGFECGGMGGGFTGMSDPYQGPDDGEGGSCMPTFCPISGGAHGPVGFAAAVPGDPDWPLNCHPEGWDLQMNRETVPMDEVHIVYRPEPGEGWPDAIHPEPLESCGCEHPHFWRWWDDRYRTTVPFWRGYVPVPALSGIGLLVVVSVLGLVGWFVIRSMGGKVAGR